MITTFEKRENSILLKGPLEIISRPIVINIHQFENLHYQKSVNHGKDIFKTQCIA